MKTFALIALSAVALSGCASTGLGGGTSQADFLKALQAMASDPRCGHTDRLQGDIGGLGSGLHVFLERNCPADPTKAPPAGLTVGQTINVPSVVTAPASTTPVSPQ